MSEIDVYDRQGFGRSLGAGSKPALLVVDFTIGFADPGAFGGGNIAGAIERTAALLDFFRRGKFPVAFSRIVYADDGSDVGVFATKVPTLKGLTEAHPSSHIVPELAPRTGELVVRKTQASAFFGTGLAPWLIQQGVDTLVVAGCTTSGCVRASVVDAASWNFRPLVARDCVGDRAIAPHEANLFDMAQKYADVLARDEILERLSAIRPGF